ncbi:MAG: group III truncated hemoglobin [Flavobacteriales bacterium]|jgi:hemoglobin|tara:strand:+ start:1006 stop:1416 length:411 start_codon:yes stop_codon:yes gene_type:complete
MKRIEGREDINNIVRKFYGQVRENEILGPVFTNAIPAGEWDRHMEKITDFWDSAIFGSMTFKGNPATSHVNLDKNNDYKITQDHFSIWLNQWSETINEDYEGEIAENMKMRARKMATGLYLGMWHHKPDDLKPSLD